MPYRPAILVFLFVMILPPLLSTGCTPAEKPEFPVLGKLSENQNLQKSRAIGARDKLFASLIGELTNSIGEKGIARSIGVCKTRAPEITRAVSEETGVRIGRTSMKLRNSNNKAPRWAEPFVRQQVKSDVAVSLPDESLGVVLPIRMVATCTLCHGLDQQIAPDVKQAITLSYPNDQATGFAEGDIRGYFWMEVSGSQDDRD